MNERSRIATSARMSEYANKKYRSRSSSVTKENKKSSSVLLHPKRIPGEAPLAYTNAALSVESITVQPARCSVVNGSCPDLLTATVEDAVRKALGGSLHNLHQDVNQIQRTLSEIGKMLIILDCCGMLPSYS
ncbi:flavin-containing monooxygenase [Caerostris darwini]|uniref:Flavin-containing monooxygenase n=1 Tax=Caerostris darwini TaxID=1538125 RepID=A0AAV4PSN9_9ARAC|nr:flavin-containing monooxygenase [Caerostris darwini]